MAVSVIVQILLVELGYSFAQTTQLNIYQWLYCIILSFVTLPLGVLLKFIPVPEPKKKEKEKKKLEMESLVVEIDPNSEKDNLSRRPRTAQENWKLARDALIGQRKPGFVELIRKTHNRGNVHFGKSRITRNYMFMEY